MFVGILLALGSSLSYGAADFFGGFSSRRHSPYQVLAMSEVVGMLLMAGLALAFGQPFPDWASALWCTLGNIIGIVGLSLLYEGLSLGNAAIVSPVAGVIGAAIPVLLSLFVNGMPGVAPLIGFAAAGPGIWLVSYNPRPQTGIKDNSLRMAVISGAAFGLFYIVMARVSGTGIFWSLAFGRLVALGLMTVILRLRRLAFPKPHSNPSALATGVLDVTGNATYMLATQNLRLDIAVTLASLYPMVTVILSGVFLKEKIRLAQWLGVMLCVLAIILITQ